jgi:hypothetical protein
LIICWRAENFRLGTGIDEWTRPDITTRTKLKQAGNKDFQHENEMQREANEMKFA